MSAISSTEKPSLPRPALELCDVSKRYGARWALVRLSYMLPHGQSLLLTGHNGSGKSTLLRLIAATSSPTYGNIRVNGVDTVKERPEANAQVALVSHSSFLYEDLTAEQNLMILARLLGIDAPKDVAQGLLEHVGLGQRTHAPVRQFSAGMRKRLAIARLLMKSPRLALLDEPFGELDPSGILQMEKWIASLQEKGTTVVLATHLVEQGLSLTHQRLHLKEGRVAPVDA